MFLGRPAAPVALGWAEQARDDSCRAMERLPPRSFGRTPARLVLHPRARLHGADGIPYALFIAAWPALSFRRRDDLLASVGGILMRAGIAPGRREPRPHRCANSALPAIEAAAARAPDGCSRLSETAPGVFPSLRIYTAASTIARPMDRLYGRFRQGRDSVFDVGSHVGDRIAAFRRLGARVVACERTRLW